MNKILLLKTEICIISDKQVYIAQFLPRNGCVIVIIHKSIISSTYYKK